MHGCFIYHQVIEVRYKVSNLIERIRNNPMEDGDKSIETTDFDTTILVPWLPRSNPLSNRGVDGS